MRKIILMRSADLTSKIYYVLDGKFVILTSREFVAQVEVVDSHLYQGPGTFRQNYVSIFFTWYSMFHNK